MTPHSLSISDIQRCIHIGGRDCSLIWLYQMLDERGTSWRRNSPFKSE